MKQTDSTANLAKVSRPSASRALQRGRLFEVLDDRLRSPVVWLSSPGGSGKTTLVSSYVESRKMPVLWYRVDMRDNDLPGFFYYLGTAVKNAAGKKATMPLLTGEYMAGIDTFSLRFFERMYTYLTPGTLIVYDDYQVASSSTDFNRAINHGLSVLPDNIRVMMLSRNQPAEEFARLQANGVMNAIDWEQLRFTLDETSALLARDNALAPEQAASIHEMTDGWAAGLVFIKAKLKTDSGNLVYNKNEAHQGIFSYFAGEVFAGFGKDVQGFLVRTSFLPEITVQMAKKLTGMKDSGDILAYLQSNNYFTERHSKDSPTYYYHMLFREFLQERAAKYLGDEIEKVRKKAIGILRHHGYIEAAARLCIEASGWDDLNALITENAPALLAQGRLKQVYGWLTGLPGDYLQGYPWLLYWLGACQLPVDPLLARGTLASAFGTFKASGDHAGVFLSWAAIVDTFVYEWRNFRPLDRYIEEIDDILKGGAVPPTTEIWHRFSTAMFTALVFRQPQHPDISYWEGRLEDILRTTRDNVQKLTIDSFLLLYNQWMGRINKAGSIVRMLEHTVDAIDENPLTKIMYLGSEAMYYQYVQGYQKMISAMHKNIGIADRTGVHLMDLQSYGVSIYAYLGLGDRDNAQRCLEGLTRCMNRVQTLDQTTYNNVMSLVAADKAEYASAVEHGRIIVKLSKESGIPLHGLIHDYFLAYVLIEGGYTEDAKTLMAEYRAKGNALNSVLFEYLTAVFEALIGIYEQDDTFFAERFREAMRISKDSGLLYLTPLRRSNLRLLTRALEIGIEPEYVRDIIRTGGVLPDDSCIHIEGWPYRFKIYTFGGFRLLTDDNPVVFSGKVQQKPLEMLKALVLFGGREVSEQRLCDCLWPDADGDLAAGSLRTTLHRLRKLLGVDDAIETSAKFLTLNNRYVWCDTWALQDTIERLGDELRNGRLSRHLVEGLFRLYRGDFLGEEQYEHCAVATREMLRMKFVNACAKVADYYERSGQWVEAVECYRSAIAADNMHEGFYRGLMRMGMKLGQRSEALAAYRQCLDVLKALGLEPSAETAGLYGELIKG
ncbi:MAG: BTAD domain-containing putative transcriptional regulator [Candidatus Magnetobacterium sp. LHC-1]